MRFLAPSTLHPRYLALASHYTFAPKFCMPAKATEKPKVEHRVYDLQRRWATPVPRVADRDAFNAHLIRCCQAERQLVSGEHADTVAARFERDRARALPTPARPFDACIFQAAQVDKYQAVQFDRYTADNPLALHTNEHRAGLKVSVFLEVEGAAHYLPSYAGNLDIMTSAALAAAEQIAASRVAV